MLKEINACWIVGEQGDSRRFGMLSDWRTVADFMVWQFSCFIIVNANKMKTIVLQYGEKAISMDVKQGLRYMRAHASSIGVILYGDDDDNLEWGHLEVCWDPSEIAFDNEIYTQISN